MKKLLSAFTQLILIKEVFSSSRNNTNKNNHHTNKNNHYLFTNISDNDSTDIKIDEKLGVKRFHKEIDAIANEIRSRNNSNICTEETVYNTSCTSRHLHSTNLNDQLPTKIRCKSFEDKTTWANNYCEDLYETLPYKRFLNMLPQSVFDLVISTCAFCNICARNFLLYFFITRFFKN